MPQSEIVTMRSSFRRRNAFLLEVENTMKPLSDGSRFRKNTTTKRSPQIHLTRRSSTYWRVTFDNPPLNIFGPEAILQMTEIMTALETDEHVKVAIFDSAVEGFFLNHSDFLSRLEDLTGLPPGPTGLQAWPDILARLHRAPVVLLALIRW